MPAVRVFSPVLLPVRVNVRTPGASHQLGICGREKTNVASTELPEASIVPPPPAVLKRIARLVVWVIEPVYFRTPPRKSRPMRSRSVSPVPKPKLLGMPLLAKKAAWTTPPAKIVMPE